MLKLKIFTNHPVPSNSYIVYKDFSDKCIIVDPGTPDAKEIISFCKEKKLFPSHIFLTHEHFDHVWGCNVISDVYNPIIVCSDNCANKIIKPQTYFNLMYYNKNEIFAIEELGLILPFQSIGESTLLHFDDYEVCVYYTPGHSKGSVSILIQNYLFTGDTLMQFKPNINKRDGGNHDELQRSVAFLSKLISVRCSQILILPGHGSPFYYESFINN